MLVYTVFNRSLRIYTIAIYTNADAASTHVPLTNEAVLLSGDD
jgi:acetyl/propionyl-CoA carboxylase alpha subunit